jgi:hypothetical protein
MCVFHFLVYAVLNRRALDMASADASGTVTVDDQRSYIKTETLRGKKTTTVIRIALRGVCGEQTVDRIYSLPLGYTFSQRTCHHKR